MTRTHSTAQQADRTSRRAFLQIGLHCTEEGTYGRSSSMDAPAGPSIVLVVEDDASLQRALGGLLRRQGFTPVEATSVVAAIDEANEHSLNAVILDLSLDGNESGDDFLAWFRQQPRYQRTPVLIYTGRTMLASDAENFILRYRAHVFYKPHPITLLVEYLQRLTAGSPENE